jgi:hypothetical protein
MYCSWPQSKLRRAGCNSGAASALYVKAEELCRDALALLIVEVSGSEQKVDLHRLEVSKRACSTAFFQFSRLVVYFSESALLSLETESLFT